MYWTRPMTKTEALNSAVFGASGVRLNDDRCEQVFRDFRLAGFAIVPIEPTTAMVFAAERHAHGDAMIRAAYAAYEKEMGDG